MRSSCKKCWLWALIVIVVLIVLWLLAAWFYGWFPFSHRPQVSPVTQAELDSLTATGTPAVVSTSTLKSLTATSSAGAAVITASVLDSLTAKPKK